MVNHHFSPPFGRICLDFFPTTKQANLSRALEHQKKHLERYLPECLWMIIIGVFIIIIFTIPVYSHYMSV